MKKVLVVLLSILILTGTIFCFAGCAKSEDKIATITFLDTDGSNLNFIKVEDEEELTNTLKLDKGSYINAIPIPKKEGYIFSGWYLSKEDIANEKIEPLKDTHKIEGDMTLYAKWAKEEPFGDKMMTGLQASVIGIGMVFVILGLLVIIIGMTKYFVNPPIKKANTEEKQQQAPAVVTTNVSSDEISEEIVAVITAAVTAAMNVEAPKANFVVRSIKRIR